MTKVAEFECTGSDFVEFIPITPFKARSKFGTKYVNIYIDYISHGWIIL